MRFRAGPLPEDFILALAEHGHITIKEISDMFSACILCERTATIALSAWIENHGYVNRKQEKYE